MRTAHILYEAVAKNLIKDSAIASAIETLSLDLMQAFVGSNFANTEVPLAASCMQSIILRSEDADKFVNLEQTPAKICGAHFYSIF